MNRIVDSRITYTTVEHEFYGCETGCCGWIAYAFDSAGEIIHRSEFDFMHGGRGGSPDEERECAREFAEAHFPGAIWNEAESDYHCPDDDY